MNTIPASQIVDVTNTQPTQGKGWKVNTSAGSSRADLSKHWLARPKDERFINLSDMYATLRERYDNSEEFRLKNDALEFIAPDPQTKDDIYKLSVGLPSGREVVPNHWSFGQLASLAGAPANYLRSLPTQLVAEALQWGMRYQREVTLIKTFSNKDQLLAATGPDYGRIPDYEIVAAVQQIAGNGTGDRDWKVPGTLDWNTGLYNPNVPVTLDNTTLFGSDRDLFIFLVDDLHPIEIGKLPSGEPDLVFRGFYIEHSEVGKSAMRLAAFYLRAICRNRIMWGVEGFQELTIRHTKFAPDRFIEMARPALESYATGSTTRLLEAIGKAKAAQVAQDDQEALQFLRDRGFNAKRAALVMERHLAEEQKPLRTIWDFAQGITAVARDELNQDNRVDLEQIAGSLLTKVAA